MIGGGGFLGRHIVDQLLERGETSVSVFDLRQTFVDERVTFHVGDITKYEEVERVVRGASVVVHTAAPLPGAPRKLHVAVNVDGVKNVIDACVKSRNVEGEGGVNKLIYTSSASVIYNGQSLVNADETVPYCKVHMDSYNETKAMAEDMVLKANGRGGLLTAAIRPSGIFGPRDPVGTESIVNAAFKGRSGVQIGNNTTLFDMTFVENAAYSHILASDKLVADNGTSGQAYLITNDNPVLFWDITKRIWLGLGYNKTLSFVMPTFIALALAHLVGFFVWLLSPIKKINPTFTVFRIKIFSSNRYFNITKAKTLLGYKPIVSMEEAIDKVTAFYKK